MSVKLLLSEATVPATLPRGHPDPDDFIDWLDMNLDDIVKGKIKEGFKSDAQRRAAFASGYKAKGKKGKKEEVEEQVDIKEDDLESLKIISNLDNEVCISYEKSKVNIDDLINIIKKDGIKIKDISTDDGDLEDVFLRLTKN